MTTTPFSSPGAPVALGEIARRRPAATRRLTALHAALLRATRGHLGAGWFGARTMLLETRGRRTGQRRTSVLVYVRDGDDLVVVPANAGAERPPAWWLNLQAAGEAVVTVGGTRMRVRPVVTGGERRERLWQRFAAVAPVEHYQAATTRLLPVVALAPVAELRCRSWGSPASGALPVGAGL